MDLKKHNDIMDKLLGQIDSKDAEIKALNKQVIQLQKAALNGNPMGNSNMNSFNAGKPAQVEKQVQKRISQLNKQHNSKVALLNQQLKSKSLQNKELRERINLKKNLQVKQKQHIAQVMKQGFDRKPGSAYDHKIAALISHHDDQLAKKDKHIQTLKRQLQHTASFRLSKQPVDGSLASSSLTQQMDQQGAQQYCNKVASAAELQKANSEIATIKKQLYSQNRALQDKCEELKSIKLKYNELTKEYYKIINEYGVGSEQFNKKQFAKKEQADKGIAQMPSVSPTSKLAVVNKSSKISSKNIQAKLTSNNFLSGLLQEASSQDDANISIDFQERFKKFNTRPRILDCQQNQEEQLDYSKDEQDGENEVPRKIKINVSEQQAIHMSQIVQEIQDIFKLPSMNDIIPYLTNVSVKMEDMEMCDNIVRALHTFFYKFGMGKVGRTDMIECLESFEDKVDKWTENSELLDELCIQAGAKRNKLCEKVTELKRIHNEYLTKLRDIEFLNEVNTAEKVMQFIEFFQLAKSNLKLPQQLKNIYDQLKYVDKFAKEANSILGTELKLKDANALERTFECVLRKLERYELLEEQFEKQKALKQAKKERKRQLLQEK